ncbi:LysR family transcriptional regulator [Streptomyces sp. GESEQ-35]|uniref:helix-turn-helix domain-containing protein n=1 Tax=Streptomyces sp. GESEQ-35 TaxID=2812657 RepID=UPI001B32C361|nr:LysR family transcriptional regulator [Streptomyces sp. GESEQ-35]
MTDGKASRLRPSRLTGCRKRLGTHIPPPALSRAIQALERAVGVPLLVRRSHATELTVAGWALIA